MDGLPKLNPEIVALLLNVSQGKEELHNKVLEVQESCPHLILLHCDYLSFGHGEGGLDPMRMCTSCGLEEEGVSYSSVTRWSSRAEVPKLSNTPERLVIPAQREVLYGVRPGRRYLNPEKEDT